MKPKDKYNYLLDTLKNLGYRMTGPRRALLRVLTEAHEPLSAQDICTGVNQEVRTESSEPSGHINIVTIYRFTHLLVELNLLHRAEFNEGFYRYQCVEPQNGSHHHPLICRRCGKIEIFTDCNIGGLISRLEKKTGFSIQHHRLEIYGVCRTCLK